MHQAQILGRGTFSGRAAGHAILIAHDGVTTLRLEDFKISGGFAVHAYLISSAGQIDAGAISARGGNMNLELPRQIPQAQSREIVLKNKFFGTTYATAELQ